MYTSTLKRMQNLLYRQKQIEGGEGDEGGVVNKGDSEEEDKEDTLHGQISKNMNKNKNAVNTNTLFSKNKI